MKDKAIKSVKECFESGNIIITSIIQGSGVVRIDAKTRSYKPDMDNFFSKWVSKLYAEKLCKENYGKPLNEMNVYKY